MHTLLYGLNAFLEDSCVLIAVAYLLTRGSLLALLLATKRTHYEEALLGAIFAIVGVLQDLVPDARYPYAAPALIVTFAALAAGARTAGMAAIGVCGGILIFRPPIYAFFTLPAVLVSLVIAGILRGAPATLRRAFLAGSLAQIPAFLLRFIAVRWIHEPFIFSHEISSVLANGIGVLLLMLVVREAQTRAEADQLRHEAEVAAIEVEKARTLVAEAQLIAIRARLNPHFLYNTLSSIAALCQIAPDKAQTALIRLGELMRRTLESDGKTPITLEDELKGVRAFLEIEGYRMGNRLSVSLNIDETILTTHIPPLALLTLLENAVLHGIAPRQGQGKVLVTLRKAHGHVLVAIADNGLGISKEARAQVTARTTPTDRPHGLRLLDQQLRLLYGSHSRLRLFSSAGQGTLASFCIPEEGQ